jgi:putative SOS response-associated peptidase YedK
MCGRYTLTRGDRIAEDFEASLGDAPQSESPGGEASRWWKPRFNVAPTQPAPVVVAQEGARRVEMMRWGLVPHWAGPDGKRAPLMINARSESLEAKAMFRDALRRRRCLVPADGFFEWLRDPKAGSKVKPQPMYMHPASGRLCAFAGLWARARTDAGEVLSFTIITGKPNELVRPIHDRMPVILDPSTYAAWLDPALDPEGARALLDVPPVGDWIAEPVSTLVNSAGNDEPACIEPVAREAPRVQQRLFD